MSNPKCNCKEKTPPTPGQCICTRLQKKPAQDQPPEPFTDPTPSSTGHSWTLNNFNIIRYLDSCRFGSVYLARSKAPHDLLVLKILKKNEIRGFNFDDLVEQEVEMHRRLKHSNIIQMYGCFCEKNMRYHILEYAQVGSVANLLEEFGKIPEEIAAPFVQDITNALIYLHTMNVTHTDIRPYNLLLDNMYRVKIANFRKSVYSMMYDSKPLSYESDIWDLGMLCYELLVGTQPFDSERTVKTYVKLKCLIIVYPDYLSEKGIDFVGQLLAINPNQRLPLKKALKHSWILDNGIY